MRTGSVRAALLAVRLPEWERVLPEQRRMLQPRAGQLPPWRWPPVPMRAGVCLLPSSRRQSRVRSGRRRWLRLPLHPGPARDVPRLDTPTGDVVHGVAAKRAGDNPALVETFWIFLTMIRSSVLPRPGDRHAAVFVQQAANVLGGSRQGLVLVVHSREEACSGISASSS
jgi:hypothetical protein